MGPTRLERWLSGFEDRHGPGACLPGEHSVVVTAQDGSLAECHVPLGPLRVDPADRFGGLVAHTSADRLVAVLLFRLGGHAAGVFDGDRLVASKVGSRLVHGRSSAGGWSQHRFARRRQGQVAAATVAAADTAAAVLLPWMGRLEALILGGDRAAVTAVLRDPRLVALKPIVAGAFLDVPDPRQRVLEQTPDQFRAVRIRLVEAIPVTGT